MGKPGEPGEPGKPLGREQWDPAVVAAHKSQLLTTNCGEINVQLAFSMTTLVLCNVLPL